MTFVGGGASFLKADFSWFDFMRALRPRDPETMAHAQASTSETRRIPTSFGTQSPLPPSPSLYVLCCLWITRGLLIYLFWVPFAPRSMAHAPQLSRLGTFCGADPTPVPQVPRLHMLIQYHNIVPICSSSSTETYALRHDLLYPDDSQTHTRAATAPDTKLAEGTFIFLCTVAVCGYLMTWDGEELS